MSFSAEFPEDFSFSAADFTPIETAKLPEYTPLAEFNLGPETIDTSHPEDPEASKFVPCSPQERLELIRNHVDTLAGPDAKLVTDEFLINDRETHRLTHLSIGMLATGETVIVATDDNPEIVVDADRERSVNPVAEAGNDELLTGDDLDAALDSLGENGRGWMIASSLAVDGAVHMTPTRKVRGQTRGKDLWVVLPNPQGGHGGSRLAA